MSIDTITSTSNAQFNDEEIKSIPASMLPALQGVYYQAKIDAHNALDAAQTARTNRTKLAMSIGDKLDATLPYAYGIIAGVVLGAASCLIPNNTISAAGKIAGGATFVAATSASITKRRINDLYTALKSVRNSYEYFDAEVGRKRDALADVTRRLEYINSIVDGNSQSQD